MIFLDDFIFSLQAIGGISVYWYNFLKRCGTANPSGFRLISRSDSKSILSISKGLDIPIHKEPKIPLKLARLLPLILKLPERSIFHSSYLRVSLQKDVCNIITVHDLAAELNIISGWRKYLKASLQKFAINRADGIICVSQTTKDSLLKVYPNVKPEAVKVIYHGFPDHFHPIGLDRGPDKQILFVGSRKGYKNFTLCINVMEKLPDFQLVLVGGGPLTEEESALLDRKMRDRYRHFKGADSETLNFLYNQSFCLVYPSIYEGFGMPVIEAMKAGCPVICAGIPVLKEIAKGSAIFIDDPYDQDAYIRAIQSLDDDAYRGRVKQSGFLKAEEYTMERNFEQTLGFYNEIYKLKFNKTYEVSKKTYEVSKTS